MVFVNNNNQDVNRFLNTVHQVMITQYYAENMADEYATKAKKLEDFFATIKSYKDRSKEAGALLTNSVADMVAEAIIAQHPTAKKTVLSHFGGGWLERDLEEIIEQTYTLAFAQAGEQTKQNLQQYKVRTGSDTGTVMSAIVDDAVKEVNEKMGRAIKRVSKKDIDAANGSGAVLADVQIKTDVQGKHLNASYLMEAAPEFQEILTLLNEATFSAKNYKSVGSLGEALDEQYPNLRIGNSNPYRAIMGSLEGSGVERNPSVMRNYYINMIENFEDEEIQHHIYHLRFIYELMGIGITLKKGGKAHPVKYLLYNDPTTDRIYVRSTAAILYEFLEQNKEKLVGAKPLSAIELRKAYFNEI